MEGAARAGARLVVADNRTLYGPTAGAPVRERLPHGATGPKGRVRARLAEALLAAHGTGRLRVAIGRSSSFFGPRVLEPAVGELVFSAAVGGRTAKVLGDPDLPHTLTNVRDFAAALVTLADHPEAFGRAWHVPSDGTVTTRQFVDLIGEEIGEPVGIRSAGRRLESALGLFSSTMPEIREVMYEFEEPCVVDATPFIAAFGRRVTPHARAIRETVVWYRRRAERGLGRG